MQHSDAPWDALKRAEISLAALTKSDVPEEQAAHWSDFLTQIDRTWNKCEAHFKKSPKWHGWASKWGKLRTADPLLLYLRQARNVDEHTTDPIHEKRPGGVGIGPAKGDSLYVHEMRIENGQITKLHTDVPVKFTIFSGQAGPVPVKNRGVTYSVPDSHLGKKVDSPDFKTLASLAYDFYKSALTEAEAFFVK